jgi:ATP-binding cassette, subfamily B, bacterial CvaB/MchF/RaxB
VLLAMMWLYDPSLALVAVGMTAIYALMRMLGYRLYCRAMKKPWSTPPMKTRTSLKLCAGWRASRRLPLQIIAKECGTTIWRTGSGPSYASSRLTPSSRSSALCCSDSTASSSSSLAHRRSSTALSRSGCWLRFLAYKDQFSQRVGKCLDTVVRLGTLSVHSERLADIAFAEPEDAGTGATASSVANILRRSTWAARGISFRYSDSEPRIIADFDLDVAPGECVALAGPSGAGNTTLIKILAGLLRPTAGTVLLDDVPLQAIGLEVYRRQIGCVLQDDRLFAGSIVDNIAGFSPSPDFERIQQAAESAAIHEQIIRMPMGYETLVGDMGSSLSGGQLQRIVIARARYRAPRVLLLDEATSHLDEDAERAINRAIRELTISGVIVAHRRSTLEMADRIVPVWPTAPIAQRVS